MTCPRSEDHFEKLESRSLLTQNLFFMVTCFCPAAGDKASLESDLSADTDGQTEGQGIPALPVLFLPLRRRSPALGPGGRSRQVPLLALPRRT